MKLYKIDEKLLQATINYLATKPYAEVFQLIIELQSCNPLEIPESILT